MSEQKIEQEIQDKGLNAPRLTPDLIDSKVKQVGYHVFPGSCLTVCCMTLANGFTVTGESACASPENFDAEIGQKIAFDQARNKIWMLEGYLLKQNLFDQVGDKPPVLDHMGRVAIESKELQEKIDKLLAFINSDAIDRLSPSEKTRLIEQSNVMQSYLSILSQRIAAFTSNA